MVFLGNSGKVLTLINVRNQIECVCIYIYILRLDNFYFTNWKNARSIWKTTSTISPSPKLPVVTTISFIPFQCHLNPSEHWTKTWLDPISFGGRSHFQKEKLHPRSLTVRPLKSYRAPITFQGRTVKLRGYVSYFPVLRVPSLYP